MNTRKLVTRQHGMSFVEVLVAMGMLGLLILASYSLSSGSQHLTKLNMDRQFATQKAISMMEELRSVAQAAAGPAAIVLDQFDNGTNYMDDLTINTVTSPADPLSSNFRLPDGNWLYSRRISVQRVGGQSTAGVRLVRVSVYKWENGEERPIAEVASIIRTLANVAPPTQVYDVYAVAIKNVPGWWVYTANLVPFVNNAINNLMSRNPGLEFRIHWITKLAYGRDEEYRPYLNRNPAAPATAVGNQPWVYFYPGTLPTDVALNPPLLAEYYPTSGFESRINIDGVLQNEYSVLDDASYNPLPFSLADQYNHAKRYPEERALYEARVRAVNPFNLRPVWPLEEPTFRLLLDDMVMRPLEYTNAIVINLHGELFPFPPVRNYSDPAKAPEVVGPPFDLRYLRAVTHPEKLAYNETVDPLLPLPANTESNDITLRVYSYETWRNASPRLTKWFPVPITVVIKGVTIANDVVVTAIEGGVGQTDAGAVVIPYRRTDPAPAAPNGQGMYATKENVGGDTLIKLFNSPFQANPCSPAGACGADTTGLNANFYLYNTEYIPSPVEHFTLGDCAAVLGFSVDLVDTNVTANAKCGYNTALAGPRNTARWTIRIPNDALNTELNGLLRPLNTVLSIETRIGDTPAATLPTTGTLAPVRDQPTNVSKTYVWRGSDLWLYGDGTEANPPNLPMTERFQFIGDPRHSPYKDLKKQYVANAATNHNTQSRLGGGYNRYFDDFHSVAAGDMALNATGWHGFIQAPFLDGASNNDGWNTNGTAIPANVRAGRIEIDIDRGFQLLRTALTASNAVYTTMTGYSYYYIGLGGEIGYDSANLFPNSIPVSGRPYNGANAQIYEQSIINSGNLAQGDGVKYVRQVGPGGNQYWWSMNWLGELWPDDHYGAGSNWRTNGNLTAGPNAADFRRILRGLVAPAAGNRNTLPAGTDFEGGLGGGTAHYTNATRRTGPPGSTDFFWTGTAASTFHHTPNSSSADVALEGLNVASVTTGYNFPLLTPIPNNRPFNRTVNVTGDNPEAFLNARYGAAFVTFEEARYYTNQGTGGPGSSLISTRNPVTNRPAFVVVNGLSPAGQSGQDFIARWSFLSLIHSYFDAGLYVDAAPAPVGCVGCPFRVRQLPSVSITSPNAQSLLVDVPSIDIQWAATWKRWDGKPYTPNYPPAFSEAGITLDYQVLYSTDNGVTWRFVQDNTLWDRGTKLPNGDPRLINGATNFVWNTPSASFPQGNYIIRVEAYRQGFPLHYSYHQFTAFIRRN